MYPPKKSNSATLPFQVFSTNEMRAPDSFFPFCFQLSRHQRTSSHCWMLSSWIWTRGSLADTATRFGTAWHCVQYMLHFFWISWRLKMTGGGACFIQPRLRQWMSCSPWCVICRQFVCLFSFFFSLLCGRFCDNSMILVDWKQKTPQSACISFVVARQVSSKHPEEKNKNAPPLLRNYVRRSEKFTHGDSVNWEFHGGQTWGWDSKPATFVRCWSDCWVRTWAVDFGYKEFILGNSLQKTSRVQVVGDP